MNNFQINRAVKDVLREQGVLHERDLVLVATPSKGSERKRYLWNLHCHGQKRNIEQDGMSFLLVALEERPSTPSDIAIKALWRVSGARGAQSSTMGYIEGSKAMDAFRLH